MKELNGLVTGVVGVAGEDGEGAVELLGEDDAGQLVGQGDESEREEEVGPGAGGGGPAVGWTDGEDEALGAVVAEAAEASGEVLGGELLAAAVEENGVGVGAAGLLLEPFEEGGFGVEGLGVAGDIAAGALDVICDEAIGRVRLRTGAAWRDCGQSDFHRVARTIVSLCGVVWV
jgi:hypothetical protein